MGKIYIDKQKALRLAEQFVYNELMTEVQRQAYNSIVFEGLTPSEASRKLGKAKDTIKTNYRRASKKVQKYQSFLLVILNQF